ncbi:LAMI_0C03466g1_1 [Lachancea mirantina]|uniref:Mitochondrial genome maintenance protein MGM101 n=1 Tax=Lachancea mirantina TaxID=1230905 RepID=A0A1G4J1I7_9SACH|nr:LAMI_0C03466g1_1 [Lachancea mirantina]
MLFRSRSTVALMARRYAGTVVKRVSVPRPNGVPSGEVAFELSSTSNDAGTAVSKPKSQSLASSLKGRTLELQGSRNEASEASEASEINGGTAGINWAVSFHGLGSRPFDDKIQQELAKPLAPADIEVKPDGLVYLPEIKYRRILNRAFGAGGWGLVPRSETIVTDRLVTREYALICQGRLVSLARGEQEYFNETGIPTATEGCKSNALMRCCKDLGIGSELWDPVFIKAFKKENCTEKFVEHVVNKKKKKIWLRKDREVEYPFK